MLQLTSWVKSHVNNKPCLSLLVCCSSSVLIAAHEMSSWCFLNLLVFCLLELSGPPYNVVYEEKLTGHRQFKERWRLMWLCVLSHRQREKVAVLQESKLTRMCVSSVTTLNWCYMCLTLCSATEGCLLFNFVSCIQVDVWCTVLLLKWLMPLVSRQRSSGRSSQSSLSGLSRGLWCI